MNEKFTKLLALLNNGPLPGRDVWDELEMDLQAASRLVEAAERAGLVEWVQGTEGRRLALREQRGAVLQWDSREKGERWNEK